MNAWETMRLQLHRQSGWIHLQPGSARSRATSALMALRVQPMASPAAPASVTLVARVVAGRRRRRFCSTASGGPGAWRGAWLAARRRGRCARARHVRSPGTGGYAVSVRGCVVRWYPRCDATSIGVLSPGRSDESHVQAAERPARLRRANDLNRRGRRRPVGFCDFPGEHDTGGRCFWHCVPGLRCIPAGAGVMFLSLR